MKNIFTLLLSALLISATGVAQTFGPSYMLYCAAASVNGNYYVPIDSAAVGATATGAMLLATHNYTLNGGSAQTLTDAFGVFNFNDSYKVFDEKQTTLSSGDVFNILNPTSGGTAFVQNAAAAGNNLTPQYSDINNALTNDSPHVLIFITPATGASEIFDPAFTSVTYSTINNQWSLYKTSGFDTFPAGYAYNVFITDSSQYAFQHMSTEGTYITTIDNPLLNGNDSAILIITYEYIAGIPGNNHPVGVQYVAASSKWAIFNEDNASIPANSVFNVLLAGSGHPAGTDTLGIAQVAAACVHAYPVPASSLLHIDAAAGTHISAATLTDMSGRLLVQQPVDGGAATTINVAALAKGIYLLRLDTDTGAYIRKVSVAGNE
jgi:hypothetical protein